MSQYFDRVLWLLIAALHVPVGAAAFLAPSFFMSELATFGDAGAHYARDLGAAQLVLGGAAVVAGFRPAVRQFVAWLLAAHLVLHALSHLVDADLGTTSSTASVLLSLLAEGVLLTLAARRAAP